MGQGSQGSGQNSNPTSTEDNTYGRMGGATDDKDISDAGQSYEIPTQRFDKLKNVQSNATGGGKSTTTGVSVFGGQSDDLSEPVSTIDESRKQGQNLHLRPESQYQPPVSGASSNNNNNRTRTMSTKYTLVQK